MKIEKRKQLETKKFLARFKVQGIKITEDVECHLQTVLKTWIYQSNL